MAAGDIYKLILHYRVGQQTAANVFHYRQTLGVGSGAGLASAWADEVLDEIVAVVSSVTVFDSLEWINYDDLSDFGIDATIAGTVGSRAGECLPVFNAWGFQYNREERTTRNGSKRFGAIAEVDQANGAPAPGTLTPLNALANSLGQLINFGGSEWWEPVIVRILPGSSVPSVVNGVKNVTFKRMTTQNSRKNYG